MGRPLNKRLFGTGPGLDLRVQANVGSGPADGFIARQRGSKRFEVNADGDTGVCVLVDKDADDLLPGEMTLSVRDFAGDVKRVVKIAARKATLGDGTVTAWGFASATPTTVEIEEEADSFSDAVTPVITISAQPTNQEVTAGETATFMVSAAVTPSASLSFQWRRNGENITGATSTSYTTPVLNPLDDGNTYSVVVSAPGAVSVTSGNATLTVIS